MKNKAIHAQDRQQGDPEADERMVPSKHKGTSIYGEHIARYTAAEELVRGKKVLDIASGSGYGTKQLARTAKWVVGVDVSAGAVEYASANFGGKNIEYREGDGKEIPCQDNEFDVVVSFETIEHLDDYETFMREISRVLKPDGLFILSTPNELEFAEGNHFHLHEFEEAELTNLAKRFYKYVKSYYQATWIGNIVGSKEDMGIEWNRKTDFQMLAPIKPEKYLYFYLLCANRKIDETVDTVAVMSQHWSDRTVINKSQLTENHISNLEQIVEAQKKELERLAAHRDAVQAELDRIHSSKRWKIMSKGVAIRRRLGKQ